MPFFPRTLAVRQKFPASPSLDVAAAVRKEFSPIQKEISPGARIAVAVGSRGITNLQPIVAAVLEMLKAAGAQAFIVPAMGSHGGATTEGQTEVLAEYGIAESTLEVPIRAAMEVERLGKTPDGVDVFFSAEAFRSDGIVVINRIKPHTDFAGPIGSGILKMMVVGLGKRVGAANYHAAASRLGYEQVIRNSARVIVGAAPILCGVGIVENQLHQTARIALLRRDELERREEELFVVAKNLMPRLPFDDIDLLIVDRLGKNISGAGMDPNIIGRGVHGYSSMLGNAPQTKPVIRRLFVRGLTPETRGNAIGIGMADLTTSRLVRGVNKETTYINALTSLSPQSAKLPIHFETDREAIAKALESLAIPDTAQAKVIRIADTLNLETLELSEAYAPLMAERHDLAALTRPEELQFDAEGNLLALVS